MIRLPIKLAALLLCASTAGADVAAQWSFRVYLDEKPIGWQRFTLRNIENEREMKVTADLAVKLLGFTVYRYRHSAVERWRGDCLQSISARTDDNGKQLRVDSEREGDTLVVITAQSRAVTDTCPMSFAYFNPAILQRTRLINTQTGVYEKVDIEKIGNDSIRAHGADINAIHYRISGLPQPIQLWYSKEGDWLGLESRVSGDKRLRYELE